MPSVYIGRCRTYDQEEVESSVWQAVLALGGIERFVRPGQRVLLKPNLLLHKPPDTAINTHPAVVRAVASLALEAGGRPIIADSPGGGTGFNPSGLRSLYRISGMQEVAEATGAELNLDCEAMAQQRGLTSGRSADLEALGTSLPEVRVPDFHAPQAGSADVRLTPPGVRRWLEAQFVASPRAGERCTGCGVCAENCPAEAIRIENRRAQMDLGRCIRCYCCHEFCPQHAIELRRSALARFLARI
jgi:ferredoxin